MRRLTTWRRCRRRDEHGQAMVESMLVMLVLCLILVGLLQVFHLSVAQLLTRYSAFCTARATGVGFAEYLLQRAARVAAIGGSGQLVSPDSQSYGSPRAQLASETLLIPAYLSGERWLEYEYWLGENEYDPRYYAPGTTPPSTQLSYHSQPLGDLVATEVRFHDYPFVFFDLMDRGRVWFESVGEATDISGNAEVANYAVDYLQ